MSSSKRLNRATNAASLSWHYRRSVLASFFKHSDKGISGSSLHRRRFELALSFKLCQAHIAPRQVQAFLLVKRQQIVRHIPACFFLVNILSTPYSFYLQTQEEVLHQSVRLNLRLSRFSCHQQSMFSIGGVTNLHLRQIFKSNAFNSLRIL